MVSRRSTKSAALRLLPLLFPLGALATFDCEVVQGGVKFDLRPLRGEHAITIHEEVGENAQNTTWTTNICAPIKRDEKIPHQCDSGTRICGVKYLIDRTTNPKEPVSRFEYVIPVAGRYGKSELDPKVLRLKTSEESADAGKEGLRLELHGGTFKTVKQTAIIDLLCDPNRTGWEGQEDGKTEPGKDDEVEPVSNSMRTVRRQDLGKQDDSKKDDDDKKKPDETKKDRSLKFVSYKDDVLRLEWRTKYACENAVGETPGESKKGSWGFFTWIVIILFLGIAAYLIFGSWLNYNRYGARGPSCSRPSTALSSSLAFKPLPNSVKPEISITAPSEKVKATDITVQVYSPFSPSSSSSSNTPIDKLDV